jgi:hypothetical protein
MPTTTTTYSFNKPVVGADEDDWGGYLNGNWDSVDDLLDGTTPVTGIDINSGTLDGVTIGGTTAGAGTFTTLTANTSITGTLATAAQPNITSVGTLTGLTVSASASLAGASTSADITFGDNDKAIFGAGSDLQIYSDGTTGQITGDLNITGTLTSDGLTVDGSAPQIQINQANPILIFTEQDQAADSQKWGIQSESSLFKFRAFNDALSSAVTGLSISRGGDISFYEDTGTTAKFFWDASAERLGINNASPSVTLDVSNNSSSNNWINASQSARFYQEDSSNPASIKFQSANNANGGQITWGAVAGDGPFMFKNYNTERMRIDSSGNVGIGTTTPQSSAGETSLTINGSTTGRLDLRGGGVQAGTISSSGSDMTVQTGYGKPLIIASGTTAYTQFKTNGVERMRIDSSGNLLVGKTSIGLSTTGIDLRSTGLLQAIRDGGTVVELNRQTSDGTIIDLRKDNTTVGSIGSYVGNLYIGSPNGTDAFMRFGNSHITPSTSGGSFRDAAIDLGQSGGRFKDLYLSGGLRGDTTFKNNAGTTEYARFDSSGNLLVGKTSSDNTTDGISLRPEGELSVVNTLTNPAGGTVLILNRKSADGTIAQFRKDGTTVGSIGTATNGTTAFAGASTSTVIFGAGDTGLKANDSVNALYPGNVLTGDNRDNAIDLGRSTVRFDDIYATNGTIQTSDQNEKQDIAELTDAEQRVAVAAKGLLRKFRWRDAVEEKGDEARTHFGIIAQDLQAAFAAEGLDAGDYAMFIHTTWTDEETGEERSRMGVRYSELLAFIIAAI